MSAPTVCPTLSEMKAHWHAHRDIAQLETWLGLDLSTILVHLVIEDCTAAEALDLSACIADLGRGWEADGIVDEVFDALAVESFRARVAASVDRRPQDLANRPRLLQVGRDQETQ